MLLQVVNVLIRGLILHYTIYMSLRFKRAMPVLQASADQSVVDLDIPFRLASYASTTIQLLGIIGVMCQVTWQVLVLFLPVAAICLWLQVLLFPID